MQFVTRFVMHTQDTTHKKHPHSLAANYEHKIVKRIDFIQFPQRNRQSSSKKEQHYVNVVSVLIGLGLLLRWCNCN